ncbi:ookinete-related protein [Babesia gibsoni]|uniref:Ookinete-related protein n=1 Tax=Babesia gibsoni TaxID=33632 RepID=A0AAD8PCS2_BABGI|nr:ookinete-related protein [Babesia gibsoni]
MAVGLDGLLSAQSGSYVTRTSLRQLNEHTNDITDLQATKVVVRKSLQVQRAPTTATARTNATEASQEDVTSNRSNVEGGFTDHADKFDLYSERIGGASSNLVIFDYDDTICPTFALACSHRYSACPQLVDPETIRDELQQLTQAVLFNLRKVVRVATLVIVTNASSEWLAQSCERYLPQIAAFFREHNVRIISARDRFENSLLAQRHWKYFIFIDLIEEMFITQLKTGEPLSVCSIGDGNEEREACMKLASIFKNDNWAFKNLKLLSQPTISYLIQQHVLLSKSFDNFFDMKTSADLCILFDRKKERD